uniref:Uncharacterized protein n=1 Tax=Ditylenchus dipsaci TaxID=166011 RepID=A0A915DNV0_9BILA
MRLKIRGTSAYVNSEWNAIFGRNCLNKADVSTTEVEEPELESDTDVINEEPDLRPVTNREAFFSAI